MKKKLMPQTAAAPRNAPGPCQGSAGKDQNARGASIPQDGRFARLEKLTEVPAAIWQSLAEDGKIDGGGAKMEETQVLDLPTKPMGISEAARTYGMSTGVLCRWIDQGLIKIVQRGGGRGKKTLMDPKDLARAVRLYKAAPGQGHDPLRDLKKDGKVEALSS